MQICVQSSIIKDAISKIFTVVDRKNSRPILAFCMISTVDDHIEIAATDLEVSAKLVIPAEISSSGKFCINAKNFLDILREMPNDFIYLTIDENKHILQMSCQEIKYSLLVFPTDDFPPLSFQNESTQFHIQGRQLQNIIYRTSHAISYDETRPFLNGIFLQQINSQLRAVATDGHRLALFDIPDFQFSHETLIDGIIIPKKGVIELKKLSEAFLEEDLTLSLDESFLYVNAGNSYFLSVRLISREYPKYQTVIPAKTTYQMKVDKNAFMTAIKRVKILASERSNGVRLILSEGSLTTSANHPALGDAIEKLDVDYSGPEMDLGINAKYLLDTLSILDDQEISFEFNNELSPVLIRSLNLPHFLGIIMPLKL